MSARTLSTLALHTTAFTLSVSYATFYRLFQNFSVGWFPELLVVFCALLQGSSLRLKTMLVLMTFSTVASFVILQLLGYFTFRGVGPHQLMLTVLARGGALYGLMNMVIGVAVGTVSHLTLGQRDD